jgi:cytochrome oxidase Cu insertion factor (SCO1/SenC/PrrC family)
LSLWLLGAIFVVPLLAAYVAYFWFPPQGHVNYGELIAPHPLPDPALVEVNGAPFRLSQLKHKWVLLVADTAACDAYCREKLIYLRQLRLAEGKDAGRIERVWLVTDAAAPDPKIAAELPGLHVVRAAGSPLVAALPAAQSVADHIYVVDPLGNLMMRYPRDPDPKRILKDLSRLLRLSKWSS